MSRTYTYLLMGVMVVGLSFQSQAQTPTAQVQAQSPQADPVPAKTLREFAAGAAHAETAGVTLPKIVRQMEPKYTAAAMRAKVQGEVRMFALIGVDGRVERSQIVDSLDADLDAAALSTLAQWRFEPGRLGDTPVRVAVEVRMQFRLH